MVEHEFAIKTPEIKKLPEIPKSREIFSGDINAAVISVQQITGFEISPEWWAKNVGNDGSTEGILDRFDGAFPVFVREQLDMPSESQDTAEVATEDKALEEARTEMAEFEQRYGDDPGAAPLKEEFLNALEDHLKQKYWGVANVETLAAEPDRFETSREDAETIVSMLHEGERAVSVEITGTTEERLVLEDATKDALTRLDAYFESHDADFSEVFAGLDVRIADDGERGGKALPAENRIVLDKQSMLMSLSEAEALLVKEGILEAGDYTRVMDDDEADKPGSSLVYTFIHELGHLVDEQSEGDKRHRVAPAQSPTKYGREPDAFHEEKDHEAFAEGFVYDVLGASVTPEMKEAVAKTVALRSARARKS